jgi:hypothetical protein
LDCLAIVYSVAADQATSRRPSWRPDHPGEQGGGVNAEGASDLHDRVNAGQAVTALKLADLSPVKISSEPECFLRETRSAAQDQKVL